MKVETTLARWSGRKLNQRMEVGARLVESDLRHWDGRRSGDLPLNQSETQRQSGPWIFPGEREARTRKVFVGEGSPYFRVDRVTLLLSRRMDRRTVNAERYATIGLPTRCSEKGEREKSYEHRVPLSSQTRRQPTPGLKQPNFYSALRIESMSNSAWCPDPAAYGFFLWWCTDVAPYGLFLCIPLGTPAARHWG